MFNVWLLCLLKLQQASEKQEWTTGYLVWRNFNLHMTNTQTQTQVETCWQCRTDAVIYSLQPICVSLHFSQSSLWCMAYVTEKNGVMCSWATPWQRYKRERAVCGCHTQSCLHLSLKRCIRNTTFILQFSRATPTVGEDSIFKELWNQTCCN